MRLVPGAALAAIACSSWLGSGCGLNMQQHYQNYRSKLVAQDYDGAIAYVDSKKEDFYGEKNRLLYYMDRAMLLHLGRRFKESNAETEKAKTAAEELWTESIAENAASWVTTDNTLSYAGEDFEKVLLHYVAAQNYMALGDYSAARVEARQITNRLELYNQKYAELEVDENAYKDDAFARWLAGMLAETEGGQTGLNDAWIDYKKAIDVYQSDYGRYGTSVPTQLVADALRVLDGLGADFAEERDALKAKFPSVSFVPQKDAAAKGRVVLIHSAGEAPYKVDDFWTQTIDGDVLRIAFPKFVAKPHSVDQARLVVNGTQGPSEVAEDITAIAIENLGDHMGRIRAKAIARAVIKFTAGKVTQNAGEAAGGTGGAIAQLAGGLFNLGNAIAEEADKRSWVSLPSRVSVSQLFVEPGSHEVQIQFLGARGASAGGAETRTVEVKAGQTVFVHVRTFE